MDEKPRPELRWNGEKAGYFDAQGVERWTVNPREIVLIAESRGSKAPANDYLLVMWTLEQGVLMSVRCPLDDRAEMVLGELANLLGFERDANLVNSAEWDSLVLWPPELAGEEYFTFAPVRAKHWWGAAVHRLMETKEKRVSDSVMEFLEERKASGEV